MNTEACIFDLDGVLVDTAAYHFQAWKEIAHAMDISFTEQDNELLKGISRIDSFNKLLEMGNKSIDDKLKEVWLERKNLIYLNYLDQMGPEDLLPGVLLFLSQLKEEKIKIALGSASKNALKVLDLLEIRKYFDAIVDGNDVKYSKPNPEVFLKGANLLSLSPKACVVFEDSIKGIEAAQKGGFKTVGVGEAAVLKEADYVIPGFRDFTIREFYRLLQ